MIHASPMRRAVYAILVIVVAGCPLGFGSAEDSSVADPRGSSLNGTWTGRANGLETADFTVSLNENNSAVSGTGTVYFPGDQNQFDIDVSGGLLESTVTLTIKLRVLPVREPVDFAGTIAGGVVTGRLNGGDIQHDGPFVNTPLVLTRK